MPLLVGSMLTRLGDYPTRTQTSNLMKVTMALILQALFVLV